MYVEGTSRETRKSSLTLQLLMRTISPTLRTANSLLTDTQYAPCGLKTSLKQPQFLSAKALHEIGVRGDGIYIL